MHTHGNVTRIVRICGGLALLLLLAACQLAPGAGPSATQGAEAQSRAAAEPTLSAASSPTPLEASELIPPPTAGPPPTATPTPLANPDRERAAQLTSEGGSLYRESDLARAEAVFIEANSADLAYLPARLGLLDVYLALPHYWQQALEVAQQALELAPEDATVLAYLAWAQQAAQQYDAAWATVLRAVELDERNVTAQIAAADVLVSVYELEEGLAHAQRAVELDPESAMAWASLGSAQSILHYWDEAAASYARAVELEPSFFVWHILQARQELTRTGDVRRARELASLALVRQPTHAWTLFLLVDLAADARDWEAARDSCTALMALNQPHTPYPDAFSCLASIYLRQDRADLADHYQKLAEELATPDRFDISIIRMRLLNDQDQCDASRRLAQDWQDARPYSMVAVRMLGISELCAEKYEEAAVRFKQVVDTLPRSVDDARLLAIAYARSGQVSQALGALAAISAFARNDPTYYQAQYEVYLTTGQLAQALDAAQRWQVLRPDDLEATVSIGLAQLADGKADAALSVARRAYDGGERSALLFTVLGESLNQVGRSAEAEEYLQRALDLNPDFFLARSYIARYYMGQDRCDQALPHLEWLREQEEDPDQQASLNEVIQLCQRRLVEPTRTPRPLRPTPDAATSLDDHAVQDVAQTVITAAGAESLRVELTEFSGEWSLAIAYSSSYASSSPELAEQERNLTFELSRLLPRIVSQPALLVIISASGRDAQTITLVSSDAAFLWMNGDLDDLEFEETWVRQAASDLQ